MLSVQKQCGTHSKSTYCITLTLIGTTCAYFKLHLVNHDKISGISQNIITTH
jgi:hypothetical protein